MFVIQMQKTSDRFIILQAMIGFTTIAKEIRLVRDGNEDLEITLESTLRHTSYRKWLFNEDWSFRGSEFHKLHL